MATKVTAKFFGDTAHTYYLHNNAPQEQHIRQFRPCTNRSLHNRYTTSTIITSIRNMPV